MSAEKWWDAVPTGAVLEHRYQGLGVATFTYWPNQTRHERAYVDLFDDTVFRTELKDGRNLWPEHERIVRHWLEDHQGTVVEFAGLHEADTPDDYEELKR